MTRLAVAATAAVLTACVLGASSAGSAGAPCPKGQVRVLVNGKPGPCVGRATFFRRTKQDLAQDELVESFTDDRFWRAFAGPETVGAALGSSAASAARWQRQVYEAAKRALRQRTGGRELLSLRGEGPFELGGFADGVAAPSGYERVKSTIEGWERQKQQVLKKEATAQASVEGEAGKLDFLLSTSWQLDACPDEKGIFTASKAITLNHKFTSADGQVTIETVKGAAVLTGRVNENSVIERFGMVVNLTATDSKGGTWNVTMGTAVTLDRAATLAGALEDPVVWTLAGEDPPTLTFTNSSGRPTQPSGGSVDVYLERVVREATAELRKDAERQLGAAYSTFYDEHACNTITYKGPARLKPGQTATYQMQMKNTSRKKGDPVWKTKAVKATGVEVIRWGPKGKSKAKSITVKAKGGKGTRSLDTATASASLTVDGVSIRGRGLDSLAIEIVGEEEPPPPPTRPQILHYAATKGELRVSERAATSYRGGSYRGSASTTFRIVPIPQAIGHLRLPGGGPFDGAIVPRAAGRTSFSETQTSPAGTKTCSGSRDVPLPLLPGITLSVNRQAGTVRAKWFIPTVGLSGEDCDPVASFGEEPVSGTEVYPLSRFLQDKFTITTHGAVTRNSTTPRVAGSYTVEWNATLTLKRGGAIAG